MGERRDLHHDRTQMIVMAQFLKLHECLDVALHQPAQKIKGKHLILKFCECLLLKNDFNMNILHYI